MLADLRFFKHKLFAVGAANVGFRCRSVGITLTRWHDKNCQQGKDAEEATEKKPPETATPTRCSGDASNDCDANPKEKNFHVL